MAGSSSSTMATGWETYYLHLDDWAPGISAVGDHVTRGEWIAYSGNTGHSTGPHLHFTIKVNGSRVDPLRYLPGGYTDLCGANGEYNCSSSSSSVSAGHGGLESLPLWLWHAQHPAAAPTPAAGAAARNAGAGCAGAINHKRGGRPAQRAHAGGRSGSRHLLHHSTHKPDAGERRPPAPL